MGNKFIVGFTIAFMLSVIVYPMFINFMKNLNLNQQVSEYSLEEFQDKSLTPTMGGVIFVVMPIFSLLIVDFKAFLNIDVLLILFAFISFALIGFYDDFLILIKKDNIGFTTSKKFLLEVILGLVFAFIYYKTHDNNTTLVLPYSKIVFNIGILYFLIVIFMLSGVSNAVNLTDGMDGLAGGSMIFALIPYIYFAFKLNNDYVILLLLTILGSLLAFMVYNVSPAKIFMGDVGSLSLGALLAAVAIILNAELGLIIIGGIFVVNTLSVIIQVGSVKLRGKRVFPYTPIHYSFIIWGIREKRVVYLFWIFGFVLMILGLLMGINI